MTHGCADFMTVVLILTGACTGYMIPASAPSLSLCLPSGSVQTYMWTFLLTKRTLALVSVFFWFLVSINGKIKTGLGLGVERREFSFVCKVQFCGCGFLYLFINLLI